MKRIIPLLLALTMLLSLLAGCGQDAESTPVSASAPTETTPDQTPSPAQPEMQPSAVEASV